MPLALSVAALIMYKLTTAQNMPLHLFNSYKLVCEHLRYESFEMHVARHFLKSRARSGVSKQRFREEHHELARSACYYSNRDTTQNHSQVCDSHDGSDDAARGTIAASVSHPMQPPLTHIISRGPATKDTISAPST